MGIMMPKGKAYAHQGEFL